MLILQQHQRDAQQVGQPNVMCSQLMTSSWAVQCGQLTVTASSLQRQW